MDNANVPIGAIQRILGHENRTTTEIYLHSLGEIEREAMAVYEQVSSQAAGDAEVSHRLSHSHEKRPGPFDPSRS